MKDLTKYFIDLSKCSEEQRKEIARIINKNGHSITSKANYEIRNGCYDELFPLLTHHEYWYCSRYANGKQELTYPEFIKLFEGGEESQKYDLEALAEDSVSEVTPEHGDYRFRGVYKEFFKEGFKKAMELNSNQ